MPQISLMFPNSVCARVNIYSFLVVSGYRFQEFLFLLHVMQL